MLNFSIAVISNHVKKIRQYSRLLICFVPLQSLVLRRFRKIARCCNCHLSGFTIGRSVYCCGERRYLFSQWFYEVLFFLSTKVRVCCDFCNKSARMLWFSWQKNAIVVIFETKVPTLWFLQQKCAYVVIFTTTIVFLVFLVQTPVFPKFLVPTLAQFIGSCQQKTVNKGLFRFWEKK